MTLRYWLALLCVVMALGVSSEAYNSRLQRASRASEGNVWAQLGWPSLPNFNRRPAYQRPYYSLRSRQNSHWSSPGTGETSYHHARWPSARPAQAPSQHHVHHTQADQHRTASSWTHSTRHRPSHSLQRPYQNGHTVDRARQPSYTVDRERQPSHTVDRAQQPSYTVDRAQQPSHTVVRERQPSHTVDRAQQPSHTVVRERQPSYTVDRAQQPSHTVVRERQPSHTVDRAHLASHTVDRAQQFSHTVNRAHQTNHAVDRVVAQPVPATRTNSRVVAASSSYSTGRRQGKQWILPRRFLVSTNSGRGRGTVQLCQNGKVWQNGRCECPYLSNWNEDTNTCDCVYGTYRHSSGHCRNY